MTDKAICFFNSTKEWGGGEKWHFDMGKIMHENGENVIFFTNENSELYKKIKAETQIKAIPVKVNNFSFLNPLKINKLKSLFQQNNINTIIMNLSSDVKFAGFAAKKAGIKNIIYRRGSAIPIKNSFLNRYIFKNILTEIIANTEATKSTVLQNNKNLFPKEKIHVIYNGIDLKVFDDEKIKTQTTNEDCVVLGNIGRLVKQKAQYLLLELAEKLKNENVNFKIIIGGKGKLEEELKQKVKEKNLEKRIEFTGFVKSPKEFISGIDIFVLPSLWEGFGYVLVEAMACEKPVVAFKISSNPEIIADNETGFLSEFMNIEDFKIKTLNLINDKNLRQKFGEKGRKRVEQIFTLENTYLNLKNLLESLN